MIVDTHAHVYGSYFDDGPEEVIKRAVKAGVGKIFLPNVDAESIEQVVAISEAFPESCFPMVGLHPCDVKEDFKSQLASLRAWLDKRRFYAIGEIGMDLYWDKSFQKQQEEAFLEQLSWATDFNLPIVIHSRNANDEVLALLKAYNRPEIRGIFHCFSGTLQQAEEMIALGFYLGIGGVLTYKNSGLDKIVEQIGLEHLVLETDAPYLPPVPHRGKKNEPAYLPYIVQKLADIKDVSSQQIHEITTQNALKVFGMTGH